MLEKLKILEQDYAGKDVASPPTGSPASHRKTSRCSTGW